ncbi:MAG: hypothetical protein KGN79_06160 [Acidobacteriota bacterium]|nr:hypothetical protein [Acidobacteriota bacterium]
MGSSPRSIEEPDAVAAQQNPSGPDAKLIRAQLARLLAHPLFSNSKRYPALLAYVVEQELLGNGSQLKERTIGVEVFGRTATYDANSDPVVRITAGEVRKRLSQYYYDPAHDGEPVIELPIGSYVPVFSQREPELPVQSTTDPMTSTFPGQIETGGRRWIAVAGLVLASIALGAAFGFIFKPKEPSRPLTNIDRFWEPVTSSLNPATFCLGEPTNRVDVSSIGSFESPGTETEKGTEESTAADKGRFALSDVITLARTAAELQARNKTFRVVPASQATFAQLREGPIVLIGGLDNVWTLRITRNLRFGFELRGTIGYLVDKKAKTATSWTTVRSEQDPKLARDYAIVARIHDKTTGQPVIIAAGISEKGTEAAGEILYNRLHLSSLLSHLPADWQDENLEAVIETQVIQGHSGPPNILAVETW